MNNQWRIALALVMMALGLPFYLATIAYAWVGAILIAGGAILGMAAAIEIMKAKQRVGTYTEAK